MPLLIWGAAGLAGIVAINLTAKNAAKTAQTTADASYTASLAAQNFSDAALKVAVVAGIGYVLYKKIK